ncbi:hypothetical protein Bca4012_084830 [Brassica carinata]
MRDETNLGFTNNNLTSPMKVSASDASLAQSAIVPAVFDELRLGRTTQIIVDRLLHFWDSPNIKENSELMGIILLWLDKKAHQVAIEVSTEQRKAAISQEIIQF